MPEYIWQQSNLEAQLQLKVELKQKFSYKLNKDIKD